MFHSRFFFSNFSLNDSDYNLYSFHIDETMILNG